MQKSESANREISNCWDKSVNLIVTDGVFSMDGDVAKLEELNDLKNVFPNTHILLDDCHGAGVLGARGRGTVEHCNSAVDIINGTLGKALGGASGGYTCGPKEVIELLRQRSRPYVFSNALAPPVVAASIRVLELLEERPQLLLKLRSNTLFFRQRLEEAGFMVLGAKECPIVPVLLKDAPLSAAFAQDLFNQGVFVVSLAFPVVPLNCKYRYSALLL